MSPQPMSFGRMVEFFIGIVLPALFEMPFFLATAWNLRIYSATDPGLFLFCVVPSGVLLCLWVVILFGVEQVRQFYALRWTTVIMGIVGLTYFFLVFLPLFVSEWNLVWRGGPVSSFSPESIMRGGDWRLLLLGAIGPVVLWMKYLPQLLRRPQ